MKSGCYFYERSLFSLKHESSSLNKVIDAFSRLVALLNTMYAQVTRFNVQQLISLPHGIQFLQVSNDSPPKKYILQLFGLGGLNSESFQPKFHPKPYSTCIFMYFFGSHGLTS
jgi:hypothetical protein